MPMPAQRPPDAADAFHRLFASKIAVLGGAIGSMVQTLKLGEADFRGARFKSHPHDLQGNNDILSITRPDVIESIHADYFAAGADLVETNTFSSTSIAQADYQLEPIVRDLNLAAVACARRAAVSATKKFNRPCFVAGAIGPLHRPDYRAVTWDQVVTAYVEQIEALLDGGVDALLVETIFDTLNSKAALFAIGQVFDRRGDAARVPVMISVTITDASGRTLAGQTIGDFYASIAHTKPFSVGIHGALSGAAMHPYVAELSRIAGCYTTCYPNDALLNAAGGYGESPADMAKVLGEFAANGWVNLVDGGCSSTPTHIAAIVQAVKARAPRMLPQAARALRLSSLEPFAVA